MIRITLMGSALAALVNWMSPVPAQPHNGHLYSLYVDGQQISSGPSCVAAWRAADGTIPAGWREIVCYQVR